MRNVRQSMDHNSPYFYKLFLDSFVPVVVKLSTISDEANITERYETAKTLLLGDAGLIRKD